MVNAALVNSYRRGAGRFSGPGAPYLLKLAVLVTPSVLPRSISESNAYDAGTVRGSGESLGVLLRKRDIAVYAWREHADGRLAWRHDALGGLPCWSRCRSLRGFHHPVKAHAKVIDGKRGTVPDMRFPCRSLLVHPARHRDRLSRRASALWARSPK